jgi:phage antirepressor YoqD-like protein
MTATKPKRYSMLKAALMLGTNQNDLFKKLRFAGLLHEGKALRNLPKEKYIRAGILTTKIKIYCAGSYIRLHEQTMITERGFTFIKELIEGNNPTLKTHPKNFVLGHTVLTKLKHQLAG